MLRKVLYILPFITMTMTNAEASQRGDKSLFRALTKNVYLTDDQKIAFFDMKQDRLEERVEQTKKIPIGKKAIHEYTKGSLSAQDWHQGIDERAERRLNQRINRLEDLHSILETYSEDQKEQVRENLEIKQHRKNKNRSYRSSKSPHGHKMARLAKRLDFSESQKELLSDLKEMKKEERDSRKESRLEKKQLFLSIINGEESLRAIKNNIKIEHRERLEAKHDKVDIWIELIDSLDEKQRRALSKTLASRKGKRHNR